VFATGDIWDYWTVLLRGFGMTVAISTISMLLGLFGGALVGTARSYGPAAIRLLCRAYTEAFRSTPPLLLFFGAYYGLSFATDLKLTPFSAAVIALTLEASALLSEAVRGALQSVGPGQWDAARALGLRFGPTLARIVLPQALLVLAPPAVGIFVAVLKDSSFASIVGLVELTRAGLLVRETTGESLRVFVLLAAAYLVLNAAVSAVGHALERERRC